MFHTAGHRLFLLTLALGLLFVVSGAGCTPNSELLINTPAGGGGGVVTVPDQPVTVVEARPAQVVDQPTAPPDPQGQTLPWSAAPLMQGVQAATGRDSALLVLPVVDGARDYRAFALVDGVEPTTTGVGVRGGTLFCAGFRQHNAAARPELELLRTLQVAGLTGPTRVVVEAVDAPCPFPGILGGAHADIVVDTDELPASEHGTYSSFSEQEVRAAYGSLIINGHGPAPRLGRPAPPVVPRVLARTTVLLTPTADAPPPHGGFFEDFRTEDPPRLVRTLPSGGRSQQGKLFQNQRFSFYSFGADHTEFRVARGQLHTVLWDWSQNIFSSNVISPRQPVQLSRSAYLRVGFEVASNATSRRYWWLSLCGAAEPGATMGADGVLTSLLVQTPFFYQPDGRNPSLGGWNCLQVFPRDGWPFDLGPDDTRPESDLRVMVNVAGAADRESVRNVSPDQYRNPSIASPGWYRQQDAGGTLLAPILDDQMLIAPATRYDLYIRRDRVILFVNGQQRLCNDFPNVPLTMAEGALGFGQVLYHSSAERLEFFKSFNLRTGQRYYIQNAPFADERSWDNLGYEEGVGAPLNFDPARCYVHRGGP